MSIEVDNKENLENKNFMSAVIFSSQVSLA